MGKRIGALSDPKQSTGWTLEDIQNNPLVDFSMGGKPYYNCRHKFIPLITETKATQKSILKKGEKEWQA